MTSYTGYQSESASSSRLFCWCDIAWSALHQSTWWNCVVRLLQPPVDKASGLLPEATSSFLVFDSEHSVSELCYLGPSALELTSIDVRQSRDNLMQFKMKLKTFLFQQFWALLWIQSNEEPYKCSILLNMLTVKITRHPYYMNYVKIYSWLHIMHHKS